MTIALGVSMEGPSGQKSSAFASTGRITVAAHITLSATASVRFQYFQYFHFFIVSPNSYIAGNFSEPEQLQFANAFQMSPLRFGRCRTGATGTWQPLAMGFAYATKLTLSGSVSYNIHALSSINGWFTSRKLFLTTFWSIC
jgi:hypothetical protein